MIVALAAICAKAQDMPDHMIKLMYTSNIIRNFYVDDPNNDKIAEEGIKAMLKELKKNMGDTGRIVKKDLQFKEEENIIEMYKHILKS